MIMLIDSFLPYLGDFFRKKKEDTHDCEIVKCLKFEFFVFKFALFLSSIFK